MKLLFLDKKIFVWKILIPIIIFYSKIVNSYNIRYYYHICWPAWCIGNFGTSVYTFMVVIERYLVVMLSLTNFNTRILYFVTAIILLKHPCRHAWLQFNNKHFQISYSMIKVWLFWLYHIYFMFTQLIYSSVTMYNITSNAISTTTKYIV